MKKRLLCTILATVMTIGCLSGCGGSGGPSSGVSDGTGRSDTGGNDESEADGETYNVVVQWPSLGDTPAGLEDVEAMINEIIEPEIGCTVTLQPGNAFSLANETALAVSTGEKLDLCLSLFSGVGDLVNSGSIIELDSLYEEYGADIAEVLDMRIAGGYYGDKLYGLPNGYINGEKYGFVCRTDILDKYGITIDENKVYTMDELDEIFKTIKAGEGDSFFCIGGTNSTTELFQSFYPYDWLGQTSSSGVLMLNDGANETVISNMYATEEYAEYAQKMYEWAQKGYFSADAATNTEEGSAQVRAGNYFGWFPGTCSGGAADYNTQTGMDMTIITTVNGFSATNMFQAILWCIPITSERPEKAMQFMNYMFKNPEVANLLQFGIEDVDYVVVEENEKDVLIDYPEGLDNTTIPYYQMFGVYGDRLKWPIRVPNSIDYNENLRTFNDSIKKFSPALGYIFVVDEVSAQYSAVAAVVNQYQSLISTGAADPAEQLPAFLNALEAAGMNEVIAENQRQYDEWMAAQK